MQIPFIIITEDNLAIYEMIQLHAAAQGFTCLHALNSVQLIQHLQKVTQQYGTQSIQTIVLDWMLPGKQGIRILKDLKSDEQWRNIPVIMLTARHQEEDKIAGLEAGADDYLTKPFSIKELLLRIKRLKPLQQNHSQLEGHTNSQSIKNGLHINDAQKKIHYKYHQQIVELNLSTTEYKLLQLLMLQTNKVLARDFLLHAIWPDAQDIQDRTIDVHIKRLRQQLNKQIQIIYPEFEAVQILETVRGFGYRLIVQS